MNLARRLMTIARNNFGVTKANLKRLPPKKTYVSRNIGVGLVWSGIGIKIPKDPPSDIEFDHALGKLEGFSEEIKKACRASEEKLNKLIEAVGKSIKITCEKYRQCLQRQIDILEKGDKVDPLSKFWDEMVRSRVEADDLKTQLKKYQSFIDYIMKLSFNLNMCYTLLEKHGSDSLTDAAIVALKRLNEEQMKLNKMLEKKLVERKG